MRIAKFLVRRPERPVPSSIVMPRCRRKTTVAADSSSATRLACPTAHVPAGMGVFRQCVSKQRDLYRSIGGLGLADSLTVLRRESRSFGPAHVLTRLEIVPCKYK